MERIITFWKDKMAHEWKEGVNLDIGGTGEMKGAAREEPSGRKL